MKLNALALILLFISATAASAQTYRWVDEHGVVSYSQIPPPSGEAETVNLYSNPKSAGGDAQERLDQMRQQLEDRREARRLASDEKAKAREEMDRRRRKCEAARGNLQKLEGLGTRLLKTSDGQYRRLTEEERQSKMQQERENMKQNCGNQ